MSRTVKEIAFFLLFFFNVAVVTTCLHTGALQWNTNMPRTPWDTWCATYSPYILATGICGIFASLLLLRHLLTQHPPARGIVSEKEKS